MNSPSYVSETIHQLGLIQPHGALLVLEESSLKIIQTSSNIETFFQIQPQQILEQKLSTIFNKSQINRIKKQLITEEFQDINRLNWKIKLKSPNNEQKFNIFAHHNQQALILEVEPDYFDNQAYNFDFYHTVNHYIHQLQITGDFENLTTTIVKIISKVTGFDRVMLYKFAEDGHGIVISESKRQELEPYLGLHYPATDVPPEARQLYSQNWLRLIPNVNYQPVTIIPESNPINQQPLDLSFAILRSVSACHVQYLKNMGVQASMSISIIKKNKLWGLIACHHYQPKYVPYQIRQVCELLGQVMSVELPYKDESEDYTQIITLKSQQTKLLECLFQQDEFIECLREQHSSLLDIFHAEGIAIYWDQNWIFIGKTPLDTQLEQLLIWLKKRDYQAILATENLEAIYEQAATIPDFPSGLLAITISQDLERYILCFRPEVLQTIDWAGNPHNSYTVIESIEGLSLTPRNSFELWKETVRGQSLPWKEIEIETARELRNAIINIVLRQADQVAKLADELRRSNADLEQFAYIASHDLQEPLGLISSYVQLLERRYGKQLDQDAKEFINFAVEGVQQMQRLIDDLLTYSRIDTRAKEFESVNLNQIVERVINNLQLKIVDTNANISYQDLPVIKGDDTQLVQLFQNLISNAIKFRKQGQIPVIEIKAKKQGLQWVIVVKDNGIGIDPTFCDRIFVIFQRLHTKDEYPGSGIGLTICKKIVERHRGRIWLESELDQGSSFYFTFPCISEE